jgi:hypothetical protein
LGRGVGLVEGESDKQTSSSTECPLREDVRWHTPVLLEDSLSYNRDLSGQWHSKFAELFMARFVVASSATRFFVQLVDLSLDALGFFALLPDLVPVGTLSSRSGVDDLEHEFGWVLLIVTLSGSIIFEVFKKCTTVLADVSEIHRLTALCQEKKAVELLEEDGAGLMDGTQDSLTGVGKLAEEGANGPGTLRVQSTLQR